MRCSNCKATKTAHGLAIVRGKLLCWKCLPKPNRKKKK